MSIEMIRMSKKNVTRLFVGAAVAVGVGLVLGVEVHDAVEIAGVVALDVPVE